MNFPASALTTPPNNPIATSFKIIACPTFIGQAV
jgi:hypothetical protein